MIETVAGTIALIAILMVLASAPRFFRERRLYGRRGRFKCTCCGNCCRFKVTPITEQDVKMLMTAGHADFHVTTPELRLKRVNGKCVFLKDDMCSVHEARPLVCRQFPFFKDCWVCLVHGLSFCPALEELEND